MMGHARRFDSRDEAAPHTTAARTVSDAPTRRPTPSVTIARNGVTTIITRAASATL
jgi:hypothetical protein